MITSPDGAEVPDGAVGEIWLHGNNIGRGYFGREEESQRTFGNKLQSRIEHGSHAEGAPDNSYWLATGDLGVYIDGELYLTGRIKDLIIIDGRNHYPHDIETTVSHASRRDPDRLRGRVFGSRRRADEPRAAPASSSWSSPNAPRASGAQIRTRSPRPCGQRCRANIRSGSPTSGWSPPAPSPAPPAANSPATRAGPSTSPGRFRPVSRAQLISSRVPRSRIA